MGALSQNRYIPRYHKVSADSKRPVPTPPAWFDSTEKSQWRSLWRSPVGDTWDPTIDIYVLERFFVLRRELAENPGTASLHAAMAKCESELCITPKSRISSRMEINIKSEEKSKITKPDFQSARDRIAVA